MKVSNGIQASAWRLAQAQSELGNDVTILSLGRRPKREESEQAATEGVRLMGVDKPGLFRREMFDMITELIRRKDHLIFHIHSIFIPQHTFLGFRLRKAGIPYVVKLGGTLLPEELVRKPVRKQLYLGLLEIRYLRGARGLIAVSNREKQDLEKRFPGQYVEFLPNAVIPEHSSSTAAVRDREIPRGFFLGKKDVIHKGIDRIFAVARKGGFSLDLYMIEHPQKEMNAEFARLCASGIPPSISIQPPVYGVEKQRALDHHDFYLHASRWEVFGNSILEAMFAGKPVILARECDLAEFVETHRLGLVVDFDSPSAVKQIADFLSDRREMTEAGIRGRNWALENSEPNRVAQKSLAIYEKMFSRLQN